MKLLVKSDIAKAKSVDRQREMDEGLKLAKRVDTLREVVAQEETSLEKFRSETVAAIGTEILALSKRRDELEKKVKRLEEEMIATMEPLDKRWVIYVKNEKANIEAEQRRLHRIEEEQVRREEDSAILNETLEKQKQTLDAYKTALSTLRTSIDNDKQEALDTLRLAKAQANGILEAARQREQDSLSLQRTIDGEQTAYNARKDALDTKEKELEQRETNVLVKELLYYSPVKSPKNVSNNRTSNRRK